MSPFNPESFEAHSNVGGAFMVGVPDRSDGPAVTAFISVNAQILNHPIDNTHDYPIHEIPLLRRLHHRRGGSVLVRANWVPGVPRLHKLTQAGFEAEWDALVARYKVNDSVNLCYALYGGVNGQPRRLDTVMKTVVEAWAQLLRSLEKERRSMTDQDVENIIALCEPDQGRINPIASIDTGILDSITIPMPAATGDGITVTEGDAKSFDVSQLAAFLVTKGVDEKTAATYAAEAPRSDKGNLDDESWGRVFGVGKHPQKRAKLVELYQEYTSAVE